MTMKILEAIELKKIYKKNVAVKGISFHLNQGEILGFLGPNGAGKTTTISMIASLIPPTKGDILLNGKTILTNPKPLRKILGVVPQEIALYPELTALENLRFFGKIYGLKGNKLEKRVEKVLEIVGLEERAKEKIEHYSGGMKRRINIGAALLHQPEILIMDEPTVGIDPQSRNHILDTVKKLAENGMTILYTSHYMEEVEYLCDRIYIMDAGAIIAEGTKNELKAIVSKNDRIVMKIDRYDKEFDSALKSIPEVEGVTFNNEMFTIIYKKGSNLLGNIFRLAEEYQINILSIDVKTPSLEDVFLQLTGRGLRD